MGQLVGCLEGMAEACRALDFPVVSGNVSLYNETKNEDGSSLAILPTPAIGGVGLLEDWEKSATIGFKNRGDHIFLIGSRNVASHLGRSLWLREVRGEDAGCAPSVDLQAEKRAGDFVRHLCAERIANAVHDVSDGGMLVAIAEMALVGGIGASLDEDHDGEIQATNAAMYFGEDQGRYIISVPVDDGVWQLAEEWEIPVFWVGATGFRSEITGEEGIRQMDSNSFVSLNDLRAAHEGFFPKLMGSELTPEF
jgi:phosphoribosylformylglycinamidine (FGAM) synthase-like enzyme